MNNKWVYLFEIEGYQVVVMKHWNEEDSNHQIRFQSILNGVNAQLCLGFPSEEDRDKAFNNETKIIKLAEELYLGTLLNN